MSHTPEPTKLTAENERDLAFLMHLKFGIQNPSAYVKAADALAEFVDLLHMREFRHTRFKSYELLKAYRKERGE